MDSFWQVWLRVKVCQEKNNYKKKDFSDHFFSTTTTTTSSPPAVSEGSMLFLGRSFPLYWRNHSSPPQQLQWRVRPGRGHPRWAPAEDLTGPCPLCLAEDIPNPPGNQSWVRHLRRARGEEGRRRKAERQIKKRTPMDFNIQHMTISGRWMSIEIHSEFHELIE